MAIGAATDHTRPAEGHYRLTRGGLQVRQRGEPAHHDRGPRSSATSTTRPRQIAGQVSLGAARREDRRLTEPNSGAAARPAIEARPLDHRLARSRGACRPRGRHLLAHVPANVSRGALPDCHQPRRRDAIQVVAQPVHGLRPPLHVLLRAERSRSAPTVAFGRPLRPIDPGQGQRRRGPPAPSSPGSAGRTSRSSSARPRIPTSRPRAASA